jgi:BCD family chlorophyll transporter-like MFS transporter
MKGLEARAIRTWRVLDRRFLPFADAATTELPLGRLLRLSLFQVSVGLAAALLNGTLNRVMIVELGVSAWLVALMVALPLVFAPFRALLGFRSDHHRSVLGWRRVPYLWYGTLLQFGGLAIMPFALLVLTGTGRGPAELGVAAAALAFLAIGAGMHTTQTAGLALAQDLAPAHARPRVVALLYVMLLVGVVGSSALFGWLLADFSNLRLVQVIQGAALVTFGLNLVALWKQEARDPSRTRTDAPQPSFRARWREFTRGGRAPRLLVAIGLGTAGFGMQDVLLEPYGGQILHLGVGATSLLTALYAGGSLCAFALAARALRAGAEPHRLAATGMLVGILGFAAVVFSAPIASALLFRAGALLIGFGGGLFGVGTLIAAMQLDETGQSGLALGAWGAVQATSAGVAIALGGAASDLVAAAAARGALGEALAGPATGYVFVYHLEIALLFAALVAIGPLVRTTQGSSQVPLPRLGLAEFPG